MYKQSTTYCDGLNFDLSPTHLVSGDEREMIKVRGRKRGVARRKDGSLKLALWSLYLSAANYSATGCRNADGTRSRSRFPRSQSLRIHIISIYGNYVNRRVATSPELGKMLLSS